MSSILDYALAYARFGLPVVPLHSANAQACSCRRKDCKSPGKHPRTPNGSKDATADPEQITHWWSDWPSANIGVAIPDDYVVLDIDPRNGGDVTLEQFEHQYGPLPETLTQDTGGGGVHYWFRAPAARLRKVGKGVDVLAKGKLVVVEPSVHASERQYQWRDSEFPFLEPTIECIPDSLIDGAASRGTSSASTIDDSTVRDIESALQFIDPDSYETFV
jgi:hypothetical protein